MSSFEAQVEVNVPVEVLAAWHAQPGALERLNPPWERVEVVRHEGIQAGARARIRMFVGPVPLHWDLVHESDGAGGFIDRQVRGPFRSWRHHHEFHEQADGRSLLRDAIEYQLPAGPLGRWLAGGMTRRRLGTLFRHRHRVTRDDLESPCSARRTSRWRIGVTGSHGFIGREVVALARSLGHEVVPFVRRPPIAGQNEVTWDPGQGLLGDPGPLDAVVHLAAASLERRWDAEVCERIRWSRVEGTRKLVESLARLKHGPPILVSASSIATYGDRGADVLDEDAPLGPNFFGSMGREWEAAAMHAAEHGMRVTVLRFGHVVGAGGGTLARWLPMFRAGLGGWWGDGSQFLSWIGLEDAAAVVMESIRNPELEGAVNAVSPEPVTSRGFAQSLGRVLRRPAWLPRPRWLMRRAAGSLADEILLASFRVEPRRLRALGHSWRTTRLEDVLRQCLGR